MFRQIKLLSIILLALILLAACGSQPKAPLQSNAPSEISSEPHITFTNKSGEKLFLGMSSEDCEKILGLKVEDGWQIMIPMPTPENPNGMLSISSLEGFIRTIHSSTHEWGMDNGISVGTDKDKASNVLGELEMEDSDDRKISYKLEDEYNITFLVGSDDKLTSVGASWPTDEGEDIAFGIRQLIGSGNGDAHIEGFISPREYLDISHEGVGEFKVTLNTAYMRNNQEYKDHFVTIDRIGQYKGRVFTPSNNVISCDVVASGKWAIWANMYSNAAIITDENSFKGTGDYATLYISPDTGGITGTWKVSHEGNGKFILKINSFFSDFANARANLLELEGPYTGEIQVENPKHGNGNIIPVVFEIITDGSWTLERVK